MVRIGVDLKKRDFVWIGLVVVLLCVGFVVATWDSSKAMFHDSEDVKITIGGTDYSLQNASDLGLIGGGGCELGSWTTKTKGSTYQATADGFAICWGGTEHFKGWTGSVKSDVDNQLESVHRVDDKAYGSTGGLMMPVKKGDYWRIYIQSSSYALYWIPLECSTAPVGGFTPAEYAGGESVTFPNGMIMKTGYRVKSSSGNNAISFASEFPTSCLNVQVTEKHSVDEVSGIAVNSITKKGFNIYIGSNPDGCYWQAWGY